jgi:hypothetical protein
MSTSGARWAAAVIAMELSIMQPTITCRWCARATAIMRSASRRDPHLASLMLMPSTWPASGGMSVATRQLSSAMTGIVARRRISPRPAMSCGTTGCSSTVTPYASSTGSMRMACLTVQPQLASTRISRSVVSRRVRRIASSRSVPSFTLRIGYSAASSTFARIFSSVSRPMVKVDRGAAFGSRPQSRCSGTPARCAARSCSAVESATRAAGLPRSIRPHCASAVSRSKGSEGIAAA